MKKLSYPDPISPWFQASIYFSLGDKDKFFEYMNEAYKQKDPLMVYFKTMGVLNPDIQKDSRFHDILKKMGMVK